MRTKKKKKIVMINGCFDLFHVGHLRVIKEAKKLGDKLIIGLNSDESRLKQGKRKPIIPQEERKAILEAIRYVDKVYIFNEKQPIKLKARIKQDMTVKGDEPLNISLLKNKKIKCSTSQIIERIKNTR